MKAIILAAGKGKRLAPITNRIPKALINIGGKTILERLFGVLSECGVSDVLIVVGYLEEQIRTFVKNYNDNDINIEIISNKEYESTDNMYSVMLCEKKCIDDSIIILNGDLIVSSEIIKTAIEAPTSNMPVEMDPDIKDGQRILIENDRIKAIGKTQKIAQGIGINIVKFTAEDALFFFKTINRIINSENRRKEWFEVGINELAEKVDIKPISISGKYWAEIDDLEDIKKVREKLGETGGIS